MSHNPYHDDGGGSTARPPVTYSQHRDDQYGSVTGVPYATYQISSLGSVAILSRPEEPPRPAPVDYTPDGPGAPGDNGYNPSTGLPWGVRAEGDKFYYQGKRVNRDGSLWTGTDPAEKLQTNVITRADGSKYLVDMQTGNTIKELSPSEGMKQPTGGGGYGAAIGGGSSAPVRDYAGEQAADHAAQMEYLEAQQDFQAAQAALTRSFQGDQAGQDRAQATYEKALDRLHSANQNILALAGQYGLQQGSQQFQGEENAANRLQNQQQFDAGLQNQQRSDALNRNMSNAQFAAKYGIDKANVEMARQKLSLEAAALYSQQMQDFDPAAAIAFNEMGGGSIANAMAGGGDALSKNALHGASLTKRTMDQGWAPLGEYQYEEEAVPPPYTPPAPQSTPPPTGTATPPNSESLGLPAWLLALINSPQPGAALPPPPPAASPWQEPVATGGFDPPSPTTSPPVLGDYPSTPPAGTVKAGTTASKGPNGYDPQPFRGQSPYSAFEPEDPNSPAAPAYTGPNGVPFQQITGSTDAYGNFVRQYGDLNPGTSSYQGSGGGPGIPGWSGQNVWGSHPTLYFNPPQTVRAVVPQFGSY